MKDRFPYPLRSFNVDTNRLRKKSVDTGFAANHWTLHVRNPLIYSDWRPSIGPFLCPFSPNRDFFPVYFDTAYYLYPDGPIAVEALRVIGVAMAEAGVAGIGRLTLSRRERMVMVEPRGSGMALFTLRAADEVRSAQFASAAGDLDANMVAIAGAIIQQRRGTFDPSTHRDPSRNAWGRPGARKAVIRSTKLKAS